MSLARACSGESMRGENLEPIESYVLQLISYSVNGSSTSVALAPPDE